MSAAVAMMAGVVLSPAPSKALEVPMDVDDSGQPKQHNGFSVRKADTKTLTALEDFARYRDKKAWETAFRSLSQAAESKPDSKAEGMLPGNDGFYIPYSKRIAQLLVTLPPDGRAAYRLFNDSRAKQLLAPLSKDGLANAEEVGVLEKVTSEYFITSDGDNAADRLGDAYFERGDFAAAERAWRSVIDDYPETDLPVLRLMAKRAAALARLGRTDELAELTKTVRDKFAGQKITIAGAEVDAADYIAKLHPAPPTEKKTDAPASAPNIALPTGDAVAWQMRFIGAKAKVSIANAANNMGGDPGIIAGLVPPTATDGKRVYVNWLGIVFAVDAANGKLLWRSESFKSLSDPNNGDQLQQIVQQVDTRRYTIAVAGDDLILIDQPPQQATSGNTIFRLSCRKTADGSVRWNSQSQSTSTLNFTGQPTVHDGVIYATATEEEQQDLNLVAVDQATGKLLWKTALGGVQTGETPYGRPMMPRPSVLIRGNAALVLTNNGALASVSLLTRKMEWAFTYPSPSIGLQQQRFGWRGGNAGGGGAEATGRMVMSQGVLYIKETGGSSVYAVDPSVPRLLWKRPVSPAGLSIAAIDSERIYLLSDEVFAFDVSGREKIRAWSATLPVKTGGVRGLLSGDRLFAFTGRGIYALDTNNGDFKIFRGNDLNSLGGALCVAGGRLISISNIAITAYEMPAKNETKTGETK